MPNSLLSRVTQNSHSGRSAGSHDHFRTFDNPNAVIYDELSTCLTGAEEANLFGFLAHVRGSMAADKVRLRLRLRPRPRPHRCCLRLPRSKAEEKRFAAGGVFQ